MKRRWEHEVIERLNIQRGVASAEDFDELKALFGGTTIVLRYSKDKLTLMQVHQLMDT